MKICIILPHFYPYIGGGEKMFYDLAKGYVARGHQVRVIARNVGQEYSGYKKVNGIEVYYCEWKSFFGHPVPLVKDMEEHVKWCDLVHTSIFTTARPVSRLARKYGKPSILTVYEVRGNKWYWVENFVKATAFYLFEQYSCRAKFTMYHTISDASREDYLRFCGKKNVRRVYLAADEMDESIAETAEIELRDYFEVPNHKKVFLFYGRPGQTKGIYVYLKAILQAKQKGASMDAAQFCFLLGKEPAELLRRFEQKVRQCRLEDCVTIRTSVPRNALCKCIQQADYVVVPSITEGFGLSALEACQMGKKLIYSDGGSLPEVVYGKCCSFHNRNSEELADKLQKLLTGNEGVFQSLPKKTFEYDVMIQNMLQLYDELLSQKSEKE